MIQIGEVLDGRYQILEEIGEGGAGVVYKAWHLSLQKYVVVKKIKDDFVGSINSRTEADILKNLHHTCLPQVYDFCQIGTQVFTVMDFVEGYTLQQHMDCGNVFDERTLRTWLKELLEVLSYLHGQSRPIIHGDIKPANIMITPQNHVCLIDFNISLDGDDNIELLGLSERYASPEQLMKSEYMRGGYDHTQIVIGRRSDLYSLGKSFYDLLLIGEAAGVSCTDALWSVISAAVAENIDDRPSSADNMLRRLLNLRKLDARYKRQQRMSWLLHVSYGICLIAAALLVYYGYGKNSEEIYESRLGELQVLAQSHNAEKLLAKGTEFLNTDRIANVAKKEPEEFAWILHAVGDGYFEQEMYGDAQRYYEEALDYAGLEQKNLYYSDLAIAASRAGDSARARAVLYEAEVGGLTAAAAAMIEAEILFAEGDSQAAVPLFEKAGESGDPDISKRAYLYLADICMDEADGEGDVASAVAYLEKIGDSEDALVLRKLGDAYAQTKNYEKAIGVYRKLCAAQDPSAEDILNLAVCYGNAGKYSSGIQLLESSMGGDYKSDYRFYANLAVLYYDSYLQSGEERDYEQASRHYEDAKAYSRGMAEDDGGGNAMRALEDAFRE